MTGNTTEFFDESDDLDAFPLVDFRGLGDRLNALRAHGRVQPTVSDAALRSLLPADFPEDEAELQTVLKEVLGVLQHQRRNAAPGFFGYVCSPGVPSDPLAAFIASALNQNVTGFSSAPGATVIERRLVDWLRQLVSFPTTAEGFLLSGGSLANFCALSTALMRAFGIDGRKRGWAAAAGSRIVLYVSESAHFSVARAAVLCGLGSDSLRVVPMDAERRMRAEDLALAISEDLREGARPLAVIATAGTTTTGAIDPLEDLVAIAAEQKLWFHVDAAYGGAALLSPELAPRLAGIERADSVSLDLHKWFYTGLSASALILRDPEDARALFYTHSDYVKLPPKGEPEEFAFFHLGPETSRRFRALAPYLALRFHGRGRLGRNVRHNVACAEEVDRLAEADPELEVVARPQLSIICFRYRPAEADEETVDAWNEEIRARLAIEGEFLLSETTLDGRCVLRVCVVGYATRKRHIRTLVERVKTLGRELSRRDRPPNRE